MERDFVAIRQSQIVCAFVLQVLIMGCGESTKPSLASAGDAVELVGEPDNVDMGAFLIGTAHPFSTALRNTGRKGVVIDSVKGSCGCMGMKVEKRSCGIGDCTTITGFVHPRKAGLFRHLITVLYHADLSPPIDSPEIRQVIIEVTGNARNTIEVTPSEILLTPTMGEPSTESIAKITNNSTAAVQIFQPNGVPNGLKLELSKKRLQANEELELRFRLSNQVAVETQYTIRLMTSHPAYAAIEIPIRILPRERIVTTPTNIHLGVISRKELLEKKDIKIGITGVECKSIHFLETETPSYLRFKEAHVVADNAFDLWFEFIDRLPENGLNGVVKLKLEAVRSDLKRTGVVSIKVPVSGLLRE